MFLASSLSRASLISVTGDGQILTTPPAKVKNGQVTNDHQQGFNELQDVIIPAGLNGGLGLLVDNGVYIAPGTEVSSHMIFLNQINHEGADPKLNDVGINWTFDGQILGVMSDRDGAEEAASTWLLGNPATIYPDYSTDNLKNRGLEISDRPNGEKADSYLVSGDSITVNMHVTQPGDWIRVLTVAAPDTGSSAALLSFGVAGLTLIRRKLLS